MPRRWPDFEHAGPADHAACRVLLCDGSRSFFAASMFLPQHTRDAATALYGFCRMADDAIDLSEDRERAMAELYARLDAIYAGAPQQIAVDRAFADVVERYAIPRELPAALLEGFAWDTEVRHYPTIGELEAYAVRVAGTVGVMMSLLMDVRCESALARACDLGVAMQLTNIARDVGEDARAGRLYLPLEWLEEAGVEPEAFLAVPAHSPGLGAVIARLLEDAERLYRRAETGIESLPRRCRPGIRAARWLYAEIGREVERRGMDAISGRAIVPGWRKGQVLLRVLASGETCEDLLAEAPVPSATFLVEAAVAAGIDEVPEAVEVPAGRIEERINWLIELFQRVDERQRLRAANAAEPNGGRALQMQGERS